MNAAYLGESGLVEREQLLPGALRVFLDVDVGEVRHAPAVLRVGVDLDFSWYLRIGQRLAQDVLGVGLLLVVVGGHTEIHPPLDLGDQQVRTRRLRRDETAAVERRRRANPFRCRRRAYDQRATHAIALRADLARL